MKKQATTKSIKAAAAKATAVKKDKKVKKADLTKVGKNKPAKKVKDETKKVKKADLTKVGKKDLKEKAKVKPMKEKTGTANAYEFAKHLIETKQMKKPTDAAARKLNIGDVIEVFYSDQKKGVLEVVVKSAYAGEDIFNVATVSEAQWGTRVNRMWQVNSDLWRKVGTMKLKFCKD